VVTRVDRNQQSIEGGEHMTRNIQIKGIRNQDPNVKLYVLALIELARQLQAEELEQRGEESSKVDLPDGDPGGPADD